MALPEEAAGGLVDFKDGGSDAILLDVGGEAAGSVRGAHADRDSSGGAESGDGGGQIQGGGGREGQQQREDRAENDKNGNNCSHPYCSG